LSIYEEYREDMEDDFLESMKLYERIAKLNEK
jgi:hypothetical protein